MLRLQRVLKSGLLPLLAAALFAVLMAATLSAWHHEPATPTLADVSGDSTGRAVPPR